MTKQVKQKLINTSRSADDFLKCLPPKQFKQIFTKIWDLRKNTRPHDSSKLVGFDNKYRADIVEYRIIYTFNETIVNVETIGKRNDGDVYKKV
jgi:mRNA-degrading endonuclease RelE of RelBE toxin-antitoxin system